MSKRSSGLICDEMDNRWQVYGAPAVATTMVASVSAPQSATSKHFLDCLSYTIKSTAAATHSVTTSVRDASVAGTVLMSFDDMIPAGTSVNRHFSELRLPATEGKAILFTTDTVLAGVKATLNAFGWTNQQTDY